MATKETKSGDKGAQGAPRRAKSGKGGKGEKGKLHAPHARTAGRKLPVPPPRLRDYYVKTVRPRLAAQFGLTNTHEMPPLEKIVLNVGMGEAIKQPKVLDAVVDELSIITRPAAGAEEGEEVDRQLRPAARARRSAPA